MQWNDEIKSILANEPEDWLAYLPGQKLSHISYLNKKESKFNGITLRVLAHLKFLFTRFQFFSRPTLKKSVDYLFFFGTTNQLKSIDRTAEALQKRGKSIIKISGLQSKKIINEIGCATLQFNLLDILKSLFLLLKNGPLLYQKLKNQNPVAAKYHFNTFCSVYSYLVYFQKHLRRLNPEFVITSNDHSPSNRCLLAVAHHLRIKTVYMQHASVSHLFPALRVNYAFLDGQYALDVYKECEKNKPNNSWDAPTPRIFLTGQKKTLKRHLGSSENIGVALNELDSPETAIDFVSSLASTGKKIVIRWHPAQDKDEVAILRRAFQGRPQVSFSNPDLESVSEFMPRISWLVAGNSSIHLEAALAGVSPIYYELGQYHKFDYFGYVKNGLAHHKRTAEEVIEFIMNPKNMRNTNVESVRYYSATYKTKWEGREGELVAEHLLNLSQRNR